MARTRQEGARAQAGVDDAGTPGLPTILWAVLGSAVVWSLHFGVTYTLVAIACTGRWPGTLPWALLTASAVALALVAWSGWVAWHRWRIARTVDRPTDDAWDARMGERTARASFLMVSGVFLAVLFGLGIVYEAMTFAMVPACEPGVGA